MTGSLILAAACAVAFVLLGRAVAGTPTQVDLDAARFAGLLGTLGAGPFLDLFNRMGQALVWLGLLAWISIACAVRRRWDIVALLVVGELSEIAVAFSKTVFDRARPLPMIGDQFAGVDAGSYPSGHVTRVFVTLGVLALYATPRRWRPAVMALTALAVAIMALARVAVLEHWLTDTLGGVLLGAAWLALIGALARPLRSLRIVRLWRTTS